MNLLPISEIQLQIKQLHQSTCKSIHQEGRHLTGIGVCRELCLYLGISNMMKIVLRLKRYYVHVTPCHMLIWWPMIIEFSSLCYVELVTERES